MKYLKRIFEASNETEVKMKYSIPFERILKDLRSDQVAEVLINCNSILMDTITLIDITDKDDVVSYIQSNRLQKFKDESVDYKNTNLNQYIWHMGHDKNSDPWKKQRTISKIGRFVKRIFDKANIKISSKEIETFVNKYKSIHQSIHQGEDNFELVSGEDIRKYYNQNMYEKMSGQLGSSCMRYSKCGDYLDIYVKNPDVVKLLILRGEDKSKIMGRALIWNPVKLDDPQDDKSDIYMDRPYTANDSNIESFYMYAEKRNWLTFKDYTDMEVQLGNYKYETYPYMDTFKCYSTDLNILYSSVDNFPSEDLLKLEETNGGCIGSDHVYSEYHDSYIPIDQAVWIQDGYMLKSEAKYLMYKDEYVHPDNEDVERCGYDGLWYYRDDLVISKYLNKSIYVEDTIVVTTSKDGDMDWMPINARRLYGTYNINGQDIVCLNDSIEEVDGKFQFKE